MRNQAANSDEGAQALSREQNEAYARFSYDPDGVNAPSRRPSMEELNRAAAKIFSLVKLRPQKS